MKLKKISPKEDKAGAEASKNPKDNARSKKKTGGVKKKMDGGTASQSFLEAPTPMMFDK
jgi:hypothetical protein